MHFGPWEFAAYGGLWISAFLLAADWGLRMAPTIRKKNPRLNRIINGGWWAFTPLILLTISGLIFFANAMNWLPTKAATYTWVDEPAKDVIAGKRFRNERVLLDGRSYRDSTFENVTFAFNGTRPLDFSGNQISGSIRLATDNPVVNETIVWLFGLGVISERVSVEVSPGIRIAPPIIRGVPKK